MTRDTPYQGLMPYGEDDAAFFFGREREGRIIASNLLASPLTVVYGESGVGKSSVLRAEVVGALRRLAEKNRSMHGVPELAVVVVSEWLRPDAPVFEEPALRALSEEAGGDVLVILDQFEDYFLYHPDEDDFATLFPRLVDRAGVRANFLISIREDALAKLDRFKGRIPGLFDNFLRLDRLDRDAAREAIVAPLERYNTLLAGDQPMSIEPDLVEAVLTQVATGTVIVGTAAVGTAREEATGTIEAPYLQLVMSRIWAEERAAGSRTLRLATLERLGGAERIVHTHVDAVLDAFGEPERDVAARVFQQLVTPSGTKVAHSITDLAELIEQPRERVEAVVEQLAESGVRIVRPVAAADGETQFEIFHDALAGALLDWRTRHVTAQRERRLVEEGRAAEDERRKALMNRFLRILAVTLIVAVIGTALLTVFAVRERDRARTSERTARSAALAANAIAQVPIDPELGVLLAREAYAQDTTDEAEGALALALSEMDVRAVMRGHDERLWPTPIGPMLTSDGGRVVTHGENGAAAVWDVATGALIAALRGHEGAVPTAAFSPDGSLVATGGEDTTVRIWDPASGRLLHVLRGHRAPVLSVRFTADSQRLVTAGGVDGTVRLWSADGRPIRTIAVGTPVYSAAFSPRGDRVVTAQMGGEARIWDTESGGMVVRLRGHTDDVVSARFDRLGRRVVTASYDNTARVWDAHTGAGIAILDQPGASGASFGRYGGIVVTFGGSTARLWRTSTGTRIATLRHADTVNGASFSEGGRLVATASEDQTARIWDVATGGLLRELRGHSGGVVSAYFTPNSRFVVTAAEDGTARTWETDTGTILSARTAVPAVAFDPEGRRLVTAGENGKVHLWSVPGGKLLRTIRAGAGPINEVSFDDGGTRVMTAGVDGLTTIWDLSTVTPNVLADFAPRQATTAAFAPDGARVVIGDNVGAATLVDVASGDHGVTVRNEQWVTEAAFSPDGDRVVTASFDGTARVWDAATGDAVAVLDSGSSPLYSVSFSPDGASVATASGDRTASVWDVASGRRLQQLRGHTGRVLAVRFSPDGRRVITAGDTTVRVWEVATGRAVAILRMHSANVNDVAFAPRGGLIASGSEDRTARLYACRSCGSAAQLEQLASTLVTRRLTPEERRQFVDR